MELMTHHLGQGLMLILMLSLPAVLTAAMTGLVVGILQAVTQVQEQTISTAPKILLVFMLIIFGGGIMMTLLTNYIREAAVIAFQEVPNQHTTILPALSQSERQRRTAKFFGKDTSHQLASRRLQGMAKAQHPQTKTEDGVAAVGIAVDDRYRPNTSEQRYMSGGDSSHGF